MYWPITPERVGGYVAVELLDVYSLIESTIWIEDFRFTVRPPGDPIVTTASIDQLQVLLGWTPTTPLPGGMEAQVDSLRKSRDAGR